MELPVPSPDLGNFMQMNIDIISILYVIFKNKKLKHQNIEHHWLIITGQYIDGSAKRRVQEKMFTPQLYSF